MAVTDHRFFWQPYDRPGKKEFKLIEHEPPTRASKQGCFKDHAYGGGSKYGRRPLIVTMNSKNAVAGRATITDV